MDGQGVAHFSTAGESICDRHWTLIASLCQNLYTSFLIAKAESSKKACSWSYSILALIVDFKIKVAGGHHDC